MSRQKAVTSLPERLSAAASAQKQRGLPPVHLWNPPFGGASEMEIARNGSWYYQGTPITRPAMVRLFSTILKREDGAYYLVTPVEKLSIEVEDAPFVAVDVDAEGDGPDQMLTFLTNVGDRVVAGPDHAIRVETRETGEPSPYVHVRDGLEALIDRKSFYRLVDLGAEHDGRLGVWSAGTFFPLDDQEAGG